MPPLSESVAVAGADSRVCQVVLPRADSAKEFGGVSETWWDRRNNGF